MQTIKGMPRTAVLCTPTCYRLGYSGWGTGQKVCNMYESSAQWLKVDVQ